MKPKAISAASASRRDIVIGNPHPHPKVGAILPQARLPINPACGEMGLAFLKHVFYIHVIQPAGTDHHGHAFAPRRRFGGDQGEDRH
jgi:hypothetical protein